MHYVCTEEEIDTFFQVIKVKKILDGKQMQKKHPKYNSCKSHRNRFSENYIIRDEITQELWFMCFKLFNGNTC